MPTRHGRQVSYHILLPLTRDGQLEAAADADGMSVSRYAAKVLMDHLDTLAVVSAGSDPSQ